MPTPHSLSPEYKKALKKAQQDIYQALDQVKLMIKTYPHADKHPRTHYTRIALDRVCKKKVHEVTSLWDKLAITEFQTVGSFPNDLGRCRSFLHRINEIKEAFKFSDWFRKQKDKLGYSNAKLAEKLNVSERQVERYLSTGINDLTVIKRLTCFVEQEANQRRDAGLIKWNGHNEIVLLKNLRETDDSLYEIGQWACKEDISEECPLTMEELSDIPAFCDRVEKSTPDELELRAKGHWLANHLAKVNDRSPLTISMGWRCQTA